jgi:hypothetical protein
LLSARSNTLWPWFFHQISFYLLKKTQPDIVLVIHTMELDYPLERDSHQDDYDFR